MIYNAKNPPKSTNPRIPHSSRGIFIPSSPSVQAVNARLVKHLSRSLEGEVRHDGEGRRKKKK